VVGDGTVKMRTESKWINKTKTGRIVYRRKSHYMRARDVARMIYMIGPTPNIDDVRQDRWNLDYTDLFAWYYIYWRVNRITNDPSSSVYLTTEALEKLPILFEGLKPQYKERWGALPGLFKGLYAEEVWGVAQAFSEIFLKLF